MPSIANITVKKNDGTTDIVYTGAQPASGDGTPAVWKALTIGSAYAHMPELRLSSRDGKQGKTRNLRATFVYPQIATNTATGVTSVVDKAAADVNWVMPKGMTQTDVNEMVSQFANLLASALIKDCVKAGFAAA